MLKTLLYPLSALYGIGVYLRNRMFDLKIIPSTEFDIPVISIGNITVGGTGKTPHTEYLIELLNQNLSVATLSRGYKRKTTGFREVLVSSTVEECGDEPVQMKVKNPEIGVFVDEDRVHGVREILKLRESNPPDVILLDDAFQHRKISPGINILLIDYNRPVKDDMLLPAGRLREGKTQMRRANIIIFTKCPDEVTPITRRITMKDVNLRPYQNLYFTKMVYGNINPVFKSPGKKEINWSEYSALMVTGIASPKPLANHLRTIFGSVSQINFPDHHHFEERDLMQIENKFLEIQNKKKIIITTEKDAVRLKCIDNLSNVISKNLYCLPIKVSFLDSEGKSFDKKIINYVRENKSNRELHKRKNQSTR